MTKPNDYRIRALVALIRVSGARETLEALHRAIEVEIAKCVKAIEEAHASGNQDSADAITDEECDQIEQLLGLAFVVAQSFITTGRARWAMAARVCSKQYGVNFSFSIGPNGFGLLRESPLLPCCSEYTVVEAINAVANYWKHVDEWPTTLVANGERMKSIWVVDSTHNQAKRTTEIAMALGMSPGSTGNLRQAASRLGVTKYNRLSAIRNALFDWAERLYQKGKFEIESSTGCA